MKFPTTCGTNFLKVFSAQSFCAGRIHTPVMDEGAIEEFEEWSDDENEVVSSTSTEEAALVHVTQTCCQTVTNDQLETAVKKQIPKGTQKSKQAGFNGHFTIHSGKVIYLCNTVS